MRLDIKILHIRIELEWIELFTAGIYLYTLCNGGIYCYYYN